MSRIVNTYYNYERQDNPKNILGDNLRFLRLHLGLTQATAAYHAGVSVSSLSFWERGAVSPNVDNLMSLLDFYTYMSGDAYDLNALISIPCSDSVKASMAAKEACLN